MKLTPIESTKFNIQVPTMGAFLFKSATVSQFRELKLKHNLRALFSILTDGTCPEIILESALIMWAKLYIEAVEQYIQDNKDVLQVPTDGLLPDEECRLHVMTIQDKIFCEYTGLNFAQIQDVDYIEYCMLVADGYKYNMLHTNPKAVEKLNACYDYMHCDEKMNRNGVKMI